MSKRQKLDEIAERVDLFPHECVIGLLGYSDPQLATVTMLKEHIADIARRNLHMRKLGVQSNFLFWTEWTLRDYADKRKSTNLTRFDYCPECGKKIDWKAIRREEPT